MKSKLLKIDIDDVSLEEMKNELNQIVDFLKDVENIKQNMHNASQKWTHSTYIQSKTKNKNSNNETPKEDEMIKIDFMTETPIETIKTEFNNIINFLEIKRNNPVVSKSWNHSTYIELDTSSMNCIRCSHCGRWLTDPNKPEPIPTLTQGTIHKGQPVCNDCKETLSTSR